MCPQPFKPLITPRLNLCVFIKTKCQEALLETLRTAIILPQTLIYAHNAFFRGISYNFQNNKLFHSPTARPESKLPRRGRVYSSLAASLWAEASPRQATECNYCLRIPGWTSQAVSSQGTELVPQPSPQPPHP